MRKKILIIFLVVLLATDLFANGTSEQNKDSVDITFVTPLVAHPVWLRAKEGFEQAGKDLNISTNWVGPVGLDVSSMINQIDTAITQKVDGIITFGLNPEAMRNSLKKANDAGIPVVLILADIPDAPYLQFIGLDPEAFGNAIAQTLIDEIGTDMNIRGAGLIPSIELVTLANMLQATQDTLKANSVSFKNYTIAESKSDMLTAVSRSEEIITTYPDLNVIYCTGAETGPAASKVVKEKNLKNKIYVLANDDIDETLDGIRDGTIFATTATNFYRYAYEATQVLFNNIKNDFVPSEKQVFYGPIVVTKENVDTYGIEMTNKEKWN